MTATNQPIAPPPAGSWIRGRWLRELTWDGLWHLATGDLSVWTRGRLAAFEVVEVYAVKRCGRRISLGASDLDGRPYYDCVVVTERPTVDLCSRCLRYSGDVVAAEFVASARRRSVVLSA